MRSRIAFILSTVVFAIAFTTVPARASNCSGAVSPCINDDTLWPHAGPARFLAVGSAESVGSGQIGFGLVTSYLSQPIVFRLVSPGPSQPSEVHAVSDQVNGTFLWSYGVSRRLELDIAVPLTFGQGGTGLTPVTGGAGLRDTAMRDLRFGFTLAIVPHLGAAVGAASASPPPQASAWGLVARLEMSAPTGDDDQFAGEGAGAFLPSVAADYRTGDFFMGAEVGARLRPTTELLGARVGTQLVTALGFGFDFLPRELLSAALEAWALPTFDQQDAAGASSSGAPTGGHITPAEWQLSMRSVPLASGDLSIQLGGGGGIPLASELPITTPRFRFTLGIRWAPVAREHDTPRPTPPPPVDGETEKQ
jgi:OmpA-OmpF porin, OOP family